MTPCLRFVALFALVCLLVCGCVNGSVRKVLGAWDGNLKIDQVPTSTSFAMNGHLQVYLTNHRFTLTLEGPQESIRVKGHWKLKRNEVTFRGDDVKLNDNGGMFKRNPNRPYLPVQFLRDALGSEFGLKIEDKDDLLKSFPIQIGASQGTLQFSKTVLQSH